MKSLKLSPEVVERAVRMLFDAKDQTRRAHRRDRVDCVEDRLHCAEVAPESTGV